MAGTTVAPGRRRLAKLVWIDRLNQGLAALAGLITATMMVNIIADVLLREYTGKGITGTLDLTQAVWMPTAIALAMGYSLQKGEHIRVGLLSDSSGKGAQRALEVIGMTFTVGVTGILAWFTGVEAARSQSLGDTLTVLPWLPSWPVRWVIVIGLIGLALQALAQILRAVAATDFKALDAEETIVNGLKEPGDSPRVLEIAQ